MSRFSRGTTCLRCHQAVGIKVDGTMAVHRTDQLVLIQLRGGRQRRRCDYAGVTTDEAKAGISQHTKLVAAYRAKNAVGGGS